MSVRTLLSGWTVIKEITTSTTPSRVFTALTKPSQLNAWFTEGAKVELRVGGRYSNQDGDEGKFLDIIPNEKIRFTWENASYATNSTVEILLKRIRDRTVVTLIHSGFKQRKDFEDYASTKSGWNWALDNLKAYLEGRRTKSFAEWLKKRKG